MNENNWKRWVITFMILLLLVIMGITMGGRERITFIENLIGNIVTPIQKATNFVGNGIANGVKPITRIWELDSENKALKLENEALRAQVIDLSLTERELEDLYDIRKELSLVQDRIDVDDYVTANVVGPEHGITDKQFAELAKQTSPLIIQLNKERKAGVTPYRDLPYSKENPKRIKDLAAEVKGDCENLVTLGIGGSALGNIALQTALNSPFYNLLEDRLGPRLFVMDNVDPVQIATLLDYLPRMDNHALAQRLGLILERLSTVQEIEEDLIAGIARQVGEHIYPLDPHEPEAGVLDNRWRIRENVDVLGEL